MQSRDFEAEDTRRDRKLASRLSKFAVTGHPSDSAKKKFLKCPSGVCILVLGHRGSFVFRLPPYNPSGERMAAISWNPSSFRFAFSSSVFLWDF
jgi:hypothetical protein